MKPRLESMDYLAYIHCMSILVGATATEITGPFGRWISIFFPSLIMNM